MHRFCPYKENRRNEILGFQSPPNIFELNFDTFQSELDFEVVLNIVGLVVIYLVIKFHSDRRTFPAMLPPSSGGASGVSWSRSLLRYACFDVLNNFHVDGFLKFGLLIGVKFNPKSERTIYNPC